MREKNTDFLTQRFNQPVAGPLPVEQWHPPLSGDMDLLIDSDGIWHHEGRPVQRESLIRLFARILRCDPDGCYYLVTPVERWRIRVEDAPFLAVEMAVEEMSQGQQIHFRTNARDWVTAGLEHPLQVGYAQRKGQFVPYVHIRGRLRARLTRSVFYELADYAELKPFNGREMYGVCSQGVFFPLE